MRAEVTSVPASAPDFDERALSDWLDQRFGAAQMSIARISGGQSNPTYFVDHGERRMVLRKKPSGRILKGAHAIEREFRIMRALASTDVPVPRTIVLHDDPELLGTPFYLMERLEGRVFHDASLAGAHAGERRDIYMSMADTLAKLHNVDLKSNGISDYGKPGNYFERQFARWSGQYANSPGKPIKAIDILMAWLEANMPEDDGRVSIAHGDFRLGNLMFDETSPDVVAVLDWELSTLGHPLADLGFCCMPWVTSPDEYGGILGLDIRSAGIPSMDEFVGRYHSNLSDTAPLEPFHIAFALFRFAVIFVGIADRSRAGNSADANAAALSPLAERFGYRGMEIATRGFPGG